MTGVVCPRAVHLALALSLIWAGVMAADSFCQAGTGKSPRDFNEILLASFTADIYSVDVERGTTLTVLEHYSFHRDTSAVYFNPRGNSPNVRFHIYDRRKKTGVASDTDGSCKVDNTEPKFGLMSWKVADRGEVTYVGEEEVSGETLYNWRACHEDDEFEYSEDLYTTGNILDWEVPLDDDFVPVKMVIKKRNLKTKDVSQVNHYFLRFQTRSDDDDDFKVTLSPPVGYSCDIKSSSSLPSLPKSIIYSAELASDPGTQFTYMVDSKRQLVIHEGEGEALKFQYRDVDSYKLGAMFRIPLLASSCEVKPYAVLGDPQLNVSLNYQDSYSSLPFETVHKFLGESDGFTYSGDQTVRGIPSKVYTKFYENYRNFGPITVIMYFSSPDLKIYSSMGGKYSSTSVLVRKDLWKGGIPVIVDNIYNVGSLDYSRLDHDPLDLSECQDALGAVEFTLLFESKSASGSVTPGEREDVKKAMKSELATTAGVDELRVHVMDMLYEKGKLMAQVRLFGPPPESSHIYEVDVSIKDSSSVASSKIAKIYHYSYSYCKTQAGRRDEVVFGSYCSDSNECVLYSDIQGVTLKKNTGCKGFHVGKNKEEPVKLKDAWTSLEDSVDSGSLTVRGYKAAKVSKYDPDSKHNLTIPNIQKYEKRPGHKISRSLKTSKYKTVVSCADSCTASLGFQCEAFTFCEKVGVCYLNSNPEQNSGVYVQEDENCDVYIRKYITEFSSIEATSAAIDTEMVFEKVSDPNLCARLCLDLTDFRCESFDYCSLDDSGASGTCSLFRKHYFDVVAQPSKTVVQPNTQCKHFSRNYLGDYDRKDGITSLPIVTKIRKSSPESCARSCSTLDTSGEGHCTMFQFCNIGSFCEFIDESSVVGDTTRRLPELTKMTGCATYSLKKDAFQIHGRSAAMRAQATEELTKRLTGQSGGGGGGQYGPGSMAVLALAMLCVGAGLLLAGLFAWTRYRTTGLPSCFSSGEKGQEMSMQFTKAQFDE